MRALRWARILAIGSNPNRQISARNTRKLSAATMTQKKLIDRPALSDAVVVGAAAVAAAIAAAVARGFTRLAP